MDPNLIRTWRHPGHGCGALESLGAPAESTPPPALPCPRTPLSLALLHRALWCLCVSLVRPSMNRSARTKDRAMPPRPHLTRSWTPRPIEPLNCRTCPLSPSLRYPATSLASPLSRGAAAILQCAEAERPYHALPSLARGATAARARREHVGAACRPVPVAISPRPRRPERVCCSRHLQGAILRLLRYLVTAPSPDSYGCPRRTAAPPAFPASIRASWDSTDGRSHDVSRAMQNAAERLRRSSSLFPTESPPPPSPTSIPASSDVEHRRA